MVEFEVFLFFKWCKALMAIGFDGKPLYFVIRDVLKAQNTRVYGKIYESTIKLMFYSDGTWIYGPGWGLGGSMKPSSRERLSQNIKLLRIYRFLSVRGIFPL